MLVPAGPHVELLTPLAVLSLSSAFAASLYWQIEWKFLAKGSHFLVEGL